MNDIICALVFVVTYIGVLSLLRWSTGKTLVITWKPFSIKIEKT
jgi:hypothetical protein